MLIINNEASLMSQLYGPLHRKLQDRFDTRRLADGVERRIVTRDITPEHAAFIESRDMFWLATIDHLGGRPSRIKVAIPVSSACSTGTPSLFPATTVTACSTQWAIFSATAM